MSYNFDDSDPMTDYFHTNFYLTLRIGSYKQPYKVEPPKLGSKDKPEIFKHPEGPAHEAMRQMCIRDRAHPSCLLSRVRLSKS